MKFTWTNDGTIQRAQLEPAVLLKLRESGEYSYRRITDMGYVQQYRHRTEWLAQTYGSVNPDDQGASFNNIDDAKAYVETQALVGITLNKLTR